MIVLKGIGGQAILPFLETPETKVQIVMIIHVGNFCVQAWGLIGSYTLRISSGNKCHSLLWSYPWQTVEKNKVLKVYPDTTAVNCCALKKGISLHRTHTDPQKL